MTKILELQPRRDLGKEHAAQLRELADRLEQMPKEELPEITMVMMVRLADSDVAVDVSDPHQKMNMLVLRGALMTALDNSYIEPIEVPVE